MARSRPSADAASGLELVITARQMVDLRDWTLQEDGIERFAYLYCEEVDGRLLTREVDPVPADQCAVQESHAVRPALDVERDRLGEALEAGLVPIMVHSHPFSDHPGFSGLDDDIMESYRNWIGQLYPDVPLGFAVVGHQGLDTAVYVDPKEETRTRLGVDVVGEWDLDTSLRVPVLHTAASVDIGRYDRSIRALTEEGQRAIADTTVAVVGLGGLGSMTAVQLARFGVEDFLFVDPDVVERSNLPRIYGATERDVDRHKVDVVGEHVVRANPEAEVQAYRGRVQDVPEDELTRCDVIVGAVDRLSARLYCNEFAIRHLRYYIDGGVAIETDEDGHVDDERGLVQLVVPGVNACMDCLGRNDPAHLHVEQLSEAELQADVERGYLDEDVASPEPAITPLNGMAASSITRLFTKVVTGYATPPDYLRIDGLNDELVGIGTHPTEGCLTCGDDGVLAAGALDFDEDLLRSEPTDDFDKAAISEHLSDGGEIESQEITQASPRPEATGPTEVTPEVSATNAESWGSGQADSDDGADERADSGPSSSQTTEASCEPETEADGSPAASAEAPDSPSTFTGDTIEGTSAQSPKSGVQWLAEHRSVVVGLTLLAAVLLRRLRNRG